MRLPNNYTEFSKTVKQKSPNDDWPEALKSLWYDAKGDWHTAHEIVDGMADATAKWVHAYLHRKEGDDWNAGYWYRQTGKSFPTSTLEAEHREMVKFLLSN